MKIAVSGGTGFIGRPLVHRLRAAGHEILLLSRHPERIVRGDGLEATSFDAERPLDPRALRGAEAIIHLAGEPFLARWTADSKRRIRESRVAGTRVLVDAAREAGTVRTLLSASGVGYYGDRGAEVLTESSSPGDDFLAQVCRDWEAAALQAAEAGIRTVTLRSGVVLHPEGGALRKMLPFFRLGLGGRVGSGAQYMSWIHRQDAVDLAFHALRTPSLSGPLNVTAPQPVTNAELTRKLATALKRPAFARVPMIALRVAFGEMSRIVLTGQRVLPQRAIQSGYTFRFSDLDVALRDLLGGA